MAPTDPLGTDPLDTDPLDTDPLDTDPLDTDHFHEKCGVFGVSCHPDAAALAALGMHALQHRGQTAAGIPAYDSDQFNANRAQGPATHNFTPKPNIPPLPANTPTPPIP